MRIESVTHFVIYLIRRLLPVYPPTPDEEHAQELAVFLPDQCAELIDELLFKSAIARCQQEHRFAREFVVLDK